LAYRGMALYDSRTPSDLRLQLERELESWKTEHGLTEAELRQALDAGRDLDVDAEIDAFLRECLAG
jgi:hypothetical protein